LSGHSSSKQREDNSRSQRKEELNPAQSNNSKWREDNSNLSSNNARLKERIMVTTGSKAVLIMEKETAMAAEDFKNWILRINQQTPH
jgi:hypothetical protein